MSYSKINPSSLEFSISERYSYAMDEIRNRISLDQIGQPLFNTAALWTVDKGRYSIRHAFPFFEINYVYNGYSSWVINDSSQINVRGGEISLFQPNTFHYSAHNIITPCSYLTLCVKPDITFPCQPFFSKNEMKEGLNILKNVGNCVVHGSSELNNACVLLRNAASDTNKKTMNSTYIRTLLDHVFICILQSLSAHVQSPYYKSIARAKQFIKEHLTERIKVNQIAEISGLGIARFHDLFRKETGVTPANYHMRLRMEQAMIKLENTTDLITDIASEFGFYSPQHFVSRFKQFFGITPSEYRNRSRKVSPANETSPD